jgi:hypothetical protein
MGEDKIGGERCLNVEKIGTKQIDGFGRKCLIWVGLGCVCATARNSVRGVRVRLFYHCSSLLTSPALRNDRLSRLSFTTPDDFGTTSRLCSPSALLTSSPRSLLLTVHLALCISFLVRRLPPLSPSLGAAHLRPSSAQAQAQFCSSSFNLA